MLNKDRHPSLPPANLSTTNGGGFTQSYALLNVKPGRCVYQFFIVLGLTRPGIKAESTVSVADALFTRPLIGVKNVYFQTL